MQKDYRWINHSKKWLPMDLDVDVNSEDSVKLFKELHSEDHLSEYYYKQVDEETGKTNYMHIKCTMDSPTGNCMHFNFVHKRQLPKEIIETDNVEFDETEEQYIKRSIERGYFHIFIVNKNHWYKVKISDFEWLAKNGFLTENDIIRSTYIDKYGDIQQQEDVSQYAYVRFTENYRLKYLPSFTMPLEASMYSIAAADDPKVKQYEDVYIEQMTTDVRYLEKTGVD